MRAQRLVAVVEEICKFTFTSVMARGRKFCGKGLAFGRISLIMRPNIPAFRLSDHVTDLLSPVILDA